MFMDRNVSNYERLSVASDVVFECFEAQSNTTVWFESFLPAVFIEWNGYTLIFGLNNETVGASVEINQGESFGYIETDLMIEKCSPQALGTRICQLTNAFMQNPFSDRWQ